MIRSVRLGSFKRFRDQAFELHDSIVLAGPNNAGKSTLLQAVATWKFGLDHWLAQREGGSKGVKRTGVALTRRDFTAVPIREMNLLWKDRVVSGGEGPGASRLLEIVVEGHSTTRTGSADWSSSTPTARWCTCDLSVRSTWGRRRSTRFLHRRPRTFGSCMSRLCSEYSAMSRSTNVECRISSLARVVAATSCGTCSWRSATGPKQAGAPMPRSRLGSP